ncbi:MAG: phosphatase PAP2 family protein [Bacteroidetes bacterium]|nr:phosphatase PAP2 family protein [Bacteroidota bacterium]
MHLLNTFFHKIEELDRDLFVLINSKGSNSLFDKIMPLLRESVFWIPLYLFLLLFILINFKLKGLWWSLFFVSTVSLADISGKYIFKDRIQRIRPCSDGSFSDKVRLLLDHCPGGYSFVSNHAVNHFAMAVFFFTTLKPIIGKWAYLSIVWATFIVYAQIYVGVHYPSDILVGAAWGSVFGLLSGILFNKHIKFSIFDNQRPT